MDEGKKNIQFTIEHIRKYLDGELSGPDMQSLEKAALDDPFLADAMEGFEESRKQSGSFESDMADLQNRITKRIKHKKRRNRILIQMKWPVAASVLLVAGVTLFTFFYITRKTNAVRFATTDKKDSQEIKSKSLTNAATDTTDTTGNKSKNSEPVRTDTIPIVSNQHIITVQMSSRKKSTNAIQKDISSADHLKKSEPSARHIYQKDYDSTTRPDPYSGYKKKDTAASPVAVLSPSQSLSGKLAGLEVTRQQISSNSDSSRRYITGIVVNEKQEPIQNATVYLLHSKNGTSTDSNGNFKLYLKNSESVGSIVINSVGYQAILKELKADSSSYSRIQLQPASMALNDVVVTGYGSAEKSAIDKKGFDEFSKRGALSSSLPDSLVNKYAAPEGGWEAYNQYLDGNKKILSTDSLLRGTEIVTFQVNAGGKLSNFNIIESVSRTHDAEIIRMIIEGPGWKIIKGKKQKCRVSLHFK